MPLLQQITDLLKKISLFGTPVSNRCEESICYVASKQLFLGILTDIIFCGLPSHFQLKKTLCDDDMAAKIEFLQQHENARFKTDLTREDIGKFWADTSI